jgi:hypothetical protein
MQAKLERVSLGGVAMPKILEPELKTYEANRRELLGKARGKFVLIKDSDLIGIFDTELDAIRQGYQRFGNVPFLVNEIVEVDVPRDFVSGHLAI